MFFKKIKDPPEFTVTEFIALDDRLNIVIRNWVTAELKNGLKPNSKLAEVAVFNFKIIYDDGPKAATMREFMIKLEDINGVTDYTFSRIQDLYVAICMSFPKNFITFISNKHIDTLIKLDYNVNLDIADQFAFGWLLHRIQHIILYYCDVTGKLIK